MYLLSSQLLRIAWSARERAFAAKTDQVNWSADTTVAIILSAAAAEGFINELAELMKRRSKCPELLRVPPQVSAFADEVERIEKKRKGIRAKYRAAAQHLDTHPFDENVDPFKAFDRLVTLRDDHMHLKPNLDTEHRTGAGLYYTTPAAYVQEFSTSGLAQKVEEGDSLSWLNRLQTAEMADWACRASLNIILAVLDMFPDVPFGYDLVQGFKWSFRPDSSAPKPWGTRA
jgi:hypothetical protein